MSGRWKKAHRVDAWELDIGTVINGTVVHYDYPPHNGAWGAAVNTTFLGHFKDLEEAKLQVEKTIRCDVERVLEGWTTFLRFRNETVNIDVDVDAAIVTCGGDMRATIKSLLVANSFLEEEHERLAASISNGFARGRHRKRIS